MAKYLIDANLPARISIWSADDFVHVSELNDEMADSEIWNYALGNTLTIVSKDSDFSDRVLVSSQAPKVIHLKIGNMRLKAFRQFIVEKWADICEMSENHQVTNVFIDRIEGIE